MLTVRQIERLWNSRSFGRLATELLQGRAEASTRTLLDCSQRVPCAALALVRLDEYAQPHHPLARTLIDTLLAAQDLDGGWGDAATTALVLRALSTSRGQGACIDRGVAFLAMLRHDSGAWPRIPIRRAEQDDLTTALVLHHLAHVPAAHHLARPVADAVTSKDKSGGPGHRTPATPSRPAAKSAARSARQTDSSIGNLSPVARHLLRLASAAATPRAVA